MRFPALSLYLLDIKGFLRKLRFDLARELVVLICVSVLLGLFYYVFSDFINEQLRSVSENLMRIVAHVISIAFILLTYNMARLNLLYSFRGSPTVASFAHWIGLTQKIRKRFLLLRALVLLGFVFILDSLLLHWTFEALDQKLIAFVNAASLIGVLLFLLFSREVKQSEELPKDVIHWQSSTRIPRTMLLYRLNLLLKSHSRARSLAIFSFILLMVSIVAALIKVPMVGLVLLFFISGFVMSSAIALLLADDLKQAWVEKSLGVSHESFISTYSKLSGILGLSQVLLTSIILVPAVFIYPGSLSLMNALQLAAIAAAPSWVFPAIMFQIEARRAVIQMMVSFLIGLFLITAIYAHILCIVLIPLVVSQSQGMQVGRFYRA